MKNTNREDKIYEITDLLFNIFLVLFGISYTVLTILKIIDVLEK